MAGYRAQSLMGRHPATAAAKVSILLKADASEAGDFSPVANSSNAAASHLPRSADYQRTEQSSPDP